MRAGVANEAGTAPNIVVTGATGYIGARLVARAVARGWRVTTLGRREPFIVSGAARHVEWSFGAPVPGNAFPSGAALVHLAHQWNSGRAEEEDENIGATAELLQAARSADAAPIVVASTVSARKDSLNRYGRVKWRLEQLLNGDNEKAARIGLIYGGPRLGQWGQMCRLVSLAPVLPMIAPWTKIQAISLDEVVDGLLSLAEGAGPRDRIAGLASNSPVSFGYFLKQLRRARQNRPLIVLPVPVNAALMLLAVVNWMPFLPHIDKERVLGLAGLPTIDTSASLAALALSPAPIEYGLHIMSRRGLIREARATMRFVLGRAPGFGAVKRYVRGIEKHRIFWPLRSPSNRPARMAGETGPRVTLSHRERLHIAALIAECEPGGGKLFYDFKGAGRARSVGQVLFRLAIEAIALPVRLAVRVIGRR